MTRAAPWLLAFSAVFTCAAAGGEASPAPQRATRPATAESVARVLRNGGSQVRIEQKLRQPFFDVPATILEVDGEGVQVYAFRDAAAAAVAAARVSPDGRRVGGSQPLWIAPPHFFRSSNLVVLYLGDDAGLLQRLETAFGAQFAGAPAQQR